MDQVREAIYRCSTEVEYDEALNSAANAVSGTLARRTDQLSTIASALRTALVGWRYSYYRGSETALAQMSVFKSLAEQAKATLDGSSFSEDALVGLICTKARILRNQGDLPGARRELDSLPGFDLGGKVAVQAALERGNMARYAGDYSEALDYYRDAARNVDSPHGKVALVHYFAAAGCEALLEVMLGAKPSVMPLDFDDVGLTLASLRLLSTPAALSRARLFPHQYAYVLKHEAMILAFSGDNSADEVMAEAAQIMRSLGSRKGMALVAYSSAVVAHLGGREAEARSCSDGAAAIARNYYPSVVSRLEMLWGQKLIPTEKAAAALHKAAAMAPAFIELLSKSRVDSSTHTWALRLATSLTGDNEWAARLASQTLQQRNVLDEYWQPTGRDLRHVVLQSLFTGFEDDLAAGKQPDRRAILEELGLSRSDAGADLQDFDLELAAYHRADLSPDVVAEVLGMGVQQVQQSWSKLNKVE